jgi:hypothetical protein
MGNVTGYVQIDNEDIRDSVKNTLTRHGGI